MNEFAEVLKILLPCLVVAGTAYFLIDKHLRNEDRKRTTQFRAESQKTTLPLRLQAYERVVLYLERISPSSIIMRTYKTGMSARLLQADLVKGIREEYEHNMAQQIYLSANAWAMVRQAKEETVKMINLAANQLPVDASGQDLAQIIFEATAKIEKMPTDVAINYVKAEAQRLFN